MPLCSRLECIWQRERCNFLIICSWDVPVTEQHKKIYIVVTMICGYHVFLVLFVFFSMVNLVKDAWLRLLGKEDDLI